MLAGAGTWVCVAFGAPPRSVHPPPSQRAWRAVKSDMPINSDYDYRRKLMVSDHGKRSLRYARKTREKQRHEHIKQRSKDGSRHRYPRHPSAQQTCPSIPNADGPAGCAEHLNQPMRTHVAPPHVSSCFPKNSAPRHLNLRVAAVLRGILHCDPHVCHPLTFRYVFH